MGLNHGARLFLSAWAFIGVACASASTQTNVITVSANPGVADSGGRLLIFATRKTHDDEQAPDHVDIDLFHPTPTTIVVGEDVSSLRHEHSIKLDVAQSAPIAFSGLGAGDYWVQAVLDGNRDYARYGRGGGDAVSAVKSVHFPLEYPVSLMLIRRIADEDPWNPADASPARKEQLARARVRVVDFAAPSSSLSAFSKRPVSIKAWVLLPAGYSSGTSHAWPTVYALGTYGSHHLDRNDIGLITLLAQLSDEGSLPPFIW